MEKGEEVENEWNNGEFAFAARGKKNEPTRTFVLSTKDKEHQITMYQEYEETPIGGGVYRGAVQLARHLQKYVNVEGKSVIELGAGTGYVGIVCALLGARHVTFTDKKELLPILTKNVEANLTSESWSGSYDTKELFWGETDLSSFKRPFDIIIGSELIYLGTVSLFDKLLKVMQDLSHEGTVIYLSYKKRYPAVEVAFWNEVGKHFQCEQVELDASDKSTKGETKDAALFVLRPKRIETTS